MTIGCLGESHSQHDFGYSAAMSTRNLLKVPSDVLSGVQMVRDVTQSDGRGFLVSVTARKRVRELQGEWAQSDVSTPGICCYVYQFASGSGDCATIHLTQTVLPTSWAANPLLTATDGFLFHSPSARLAQWVPRCNFFH